MEINNNLIFLVYFLIMMIAIVIPELYYGMKEAQKFGEEELNKR